MASIEQYLQKIKSAVYGKDVRDSIHDSIKAINDEASAAVTGATEKASEAAQSATSAATSAQTATNAATSAQSVLDSIPQSYNDLVEKVGNDDISSVGSSITASILALFARPSGSSDVDTELDAESTNSIANSVVTEKFEEIDTDLSGVKEQLFSGDYEDLTNKPTIPDISGIESDLGEVKEHLEEVDKSISANMLQVSITCGKIIKAYTKAYSDSACTDSVGSYNVPYYVRLDSSGNYIMPTWRFTTPDLVYDGTVSNDISFIDNHDGTITVGNRSNSSGTLLTIGTFQAKQGETYKITGCPSGGGEGKYRLWCNSNSAFPVGHRLQDTGNGLSMTALADELIEVQIDISSGQNFYDYVFKPMITTNANATVSDFVKFTGGEGQLNKDVAGIEEDIKVLTTNILKPTLNSMVNDTVAIERNTDDTYTFRGTASKNISGNIGTAKVKGGITYALVGGMNYEARLSLYVDGDWKYSQYGTPLVFTPSSDQTIQIGYVITTSYFNGSVLKPMISTNLNVQYSDYVPYTGSTGKLNSDVAELNNNLDKLVIRKYIGNLSVTVAANNVKRVEPTIPQKDGYSVVACFVIDVNNLSAIPIINSRSDGKFVFKNLSSSEITTNYSIIVIYVKSNYYTTE